MIRGYVYFIAPIGGGPVKIGFSKLPQQRLEGLFTWSPVPLEILVAVRGTLRDEKSVQDKFVSKRMHCEWFEPHAELFTYIDKIKKANRLLGLKPPDMSIRAKGDRRRKLLAHVIGADRKLSFAVSQTPA